MTIRVRQNAPRALQFTATAEGHELPLDMPQPQGAGPDPHDYFDTSLGGCKAMTVMLYAKRKEIPLESVDVAVVRDAGEESKGIYRLTAKLPLYGPLSEDRTRVVTGKSVSARVDIGGRRRLKTT